MNTIALDIISNLLPCRIALVIPNGIHTRYESIKPDSPKIMEICRRSLIRVETFFPRISEYPRNPVIIPR